FSGGSSGLSIGHISPEAAAGGDIALVRDGDPVYIDVAERRLEIQVDDAELARRREEELKRDKPFTPRKERPRKVSKALRAYAKMASSANKGAVRIVDQARESRPRKAVSPRGYAKAPLAHCEGCRRKTLRG